MVHRDAEEVFEDLVSVCIMVIACCIKEVPIWEGTEEVGKR